MPGICNSITVVIFTQKNTCTLTGYLYNGNHIKAIHINYMRVITMYTLEYRHKRQNKRWSAWFTESQHDDMWEAIQALGKHVSIYETFSVRVITKETDKVIAEYKFK